MYPKQDALVSIIVPSWTGDVQRLVASIKAQTYQNYELHVVTRVSPAGHARNQGVAQTQGQIIVFIDDDAYFGHERVLEMLVTSVASDPSIGVVGTSMLIPPDANRLQKRIAVEVPRMVYPVMRDDVESNPPLDRYGYTGITTTCCALRRAVIEEVGGFAQSLPTGPEDTEFFYRIRQIGYRFLIPRNCWVYHDPPKRLSILLRKSFRNGIGHALEARMAPDRHMDVVPLQKWYGKVFVGLSPLFFIPSVFISLYFNPSRHWHIGFRPLKALSTYATLYGYTWGWFYGSR